MIFKTHFLIFFLLTALLLSCRNDDLTTLKTDSETAYFVFGSYYGECAGDQCVSYFVIENEKLYKIASHQYPKPAVTMANYIPLPQNSYEAVSDVVAFPENLLKEKDTVLGCPDCGDWGGLYIEVISNGEKKYWFIDKMKSNLPAYLHDYVDLVNERIEFLKK
jgi:hypothetical protein